MGIIASCRPFPGLSVFRLPAELCRKRDVSIPPSLPQCLIGHPSPQTSNAPSLASAESLTLSVFPLTKNIPGKNQSISLNHFRSVLTMDYPFPEYAGISIFGRSRVKISSFQPRKIFDVKWTLYQFSILGHTK